MKKKLADSQQQKKKSKKGEKNAEKPAKKTKNKKKSTSAKKSDKETSPKKRKAPKKAKKEVSEEMSQEVEAQAPKKSAASKKAKKPKTSQQKGSAAQKEKKSPKKASSKKAKGQPKKSKKGPESKPQNAKRQSPKSIWRARRWRFVDKIFTVLFVLGLLASVGGVMGINKWSQRFGAEVHLLEIRHIGMRARACWQYLSGRLVPSKKESSSLGYEREVYTFALRYKLSPTLLKAMIRTASKFNPHLVGKRGTVGLTQITPEQAEKLGIKGNLFIPSLNIRAGALEFKKLKMQTGSAVNALQKYFAPEVSIKVPQEADAKKKIDLSLETLEEETLQELSKRYHPKVIEVLKTYLMFKADPGREIRRASHRKVRKKSKKRRTRKSFRFRWRNTRKRKPEKRRRKLRRVRKRSVIQRRRVHVKRDAQRRRTQRKTVRKRKPKKRKDDGWSTM